VDPIGPVRPVVSVDHEVVAAEVRSLLRRLVEDGGRLVEVFARSRSMRAVDIQALTAVRLAERGGEPQTPGDLSQTLLLTSGAVTGLVDRLVRAGLMRREPDRQDRRRVRLRTTEEGAQVAGELLDLAQDGTQDVLSGFDTDELRIVRRFLDEIASVSTGYLWALEAPRPGEAGEH
jgi:DNA-binding MarR family transcriptional regulator